jgi:hypothetical protein
MAKRRRSAKRNPSPTTSALIGAFAGVVAASSSTAASCNAVRADTFMKRALIGTVVGGTSALLVTMFASGPDRGE